MAGRSAAPLRLLSRKAVHSSDIRAVRRDRHGFLLIEALVAVAILAGVATVALQVISSSSDRDERATARLRSMLAADTLIARVGLDLPLQPQKAMGRFQDGSNWRLDVRPYEAEGPPGGQDGRLLRIEVEVTPKRRSFEAVRLVTLRLVGMPL